MSTKVRKLHPSKLKWEITQRQIKMDLQLCESLQKLALMQLVVDKSAI